MQLHDDDVVPADWDATQTKRGVAKIRKMIEGEGLVPEFIAPRLWEDPRTIDGGITSNSKSDRQYAIDRSKRAVDIARMIGTKLIVWWPAREGSYTRESKDPAAATGPKVNDIMKGSEGAFGILVEQTMKIFRYQPENRQYFSFMFPSWEAAVDASREIMQGEFGMPAVYRISDPEETDHGLKLFGAGGKKWFESLMALTGKKPGERCIAMGTAEGEKGFARHVKAQIKKISRRHGATYLSGFPAKKWEKTRYKEPMMREDWMDYGIIADTLETAVTWENLHRVHQHVRAFVKGRPRTVCMTHASHFYPNGTNLYFIFMLKPDSWEEFSKFHAGIISAIVQAGGSISHHHGVGRLLAPWLENYLGPEQMAVLRVLKNHFDPQNLMNPGGLLALEPPAAER